MTPFDELVLDTLADPAISHAVHTRRSALRSAAGAAALALSGLPVGLAALTERAHAQTGAGDTAALQLALKLEHLEAAFYTAAYDRYNAASGTADADQLFSPGEDAVIAQIRAHEAAHVTLLQSALGSGAPAAGTYDFSGGGGAGDGPFARAIGTAERASKDDFFKLAQLLEDLGVRAYVGQLGGLTGSATAATAARILTVEARHAAIVRTLRTSSITQGVMAGYLGPNPWPGYATSTAGLYDFGYSRRAGASGKSQADLAALVYGPVTPKAQGVQAPSPGEDNLVQSSSQATYVLKPVSTAIDFEPSAEAFDEPMSVSNVAAVAALFGVA